MNKLEHFFLQNYIKHPKRTLMRFSFVFMVLGIVLSVAILSAGLNLFEGYERTLKSVLLDSFSHITLQSQLNEYLSRAQVEEAASKLSNRKEIVNISANISYSAMVQEDQSIRGALIRAYYQPTGVSEPYLRYLDKGYEKLDQGSVYIGFYMAKELGKEPGDSLKIVYPQLDRISMLGLFPSEHYYRIAGIYRSGYYESDRSIVIMTPKDAQALLLIDDSYSKLELRLVPSQIDNAVDLGEAMKLGLGSRYEAIPWNYSSESLCRLIRMEKWLIFMIFSFLVLIAGLNVVSAVITIIYDKKNEIAVLKTIGATARSIKNLLFYRIALVGVASVLLGQLVGWLLSLFIVNQNFYSLKGEVYFIDQLTIHVSPINQLIILGVASLMIFSCILIPLKRIDKLQIMDLLRNP